MEKGFRMQSLLFWLSGWRFLKAKFAIFDHLINVSQSTRCYKSAVWLKVPQCKVYYEYMFSSVKMFRNPKFTICACLVTFFTMQSSLYFLFFPFFFLFGNKSVRIYIFKGLSGQVLLISRGATSSCQTQFFLGESKATGVNPPPPKQKIQLDVS